MTTASTIGMSSISHGTSVYRFGPSQVKGLQRASNTGSNRTRRPPGNSTYWQAWPSHVTRRFGVSRVARKVGFRTGTVGGVVSGMFAFLVSLRLHYIKFRLLYQMAMMNAYFTMAHPIAGPLKSRQLSQGLSKPLPFFRWCFLFLASSGTPPVMEAGETVAA